MSTNGRLRPWRHVQGIGSSFGTVSGLGMIGSFHQDEEKKIEQMGKAMSGLAIGVLLGPPLSGWAPKTSGFIFSSRGPSSISAISIQLGSTR